MSHAVPVPRTRWMRLAVGLVLTATLVGAITALATDGRQSRVVVAYFASATGLYPGDSVRVAGVPVGSIDAIEPRHDDVKVTMSLPADVPLPADVNAVVMAPNLVAARFIQLAPAYESGPLLPAGATVELSRTATPVEWDEVKSELTKLTAQLGPSTGSMKGPLSAFIDQAAETFDGKGESFRDALRELSQTAGRLGDSRTDVFGTIKNLQVVIDTTKFIRESTHELIFTLGLSALLTSIVCYLFLGSWGSALNVILAIPTSLIGAFIFLAALGPIQVHASVPLPPPIPRSLPAVAGVSQGQARVIKMPTLSSSFARNSGGMTS